MVAIKADLEESDIPIHVDIVDFKQAQKNFTDIAKQHTIPLHLS